MSFESFFEQEQPEVSGPAGIDEQILKKTLILAFEIIVQTHVTRYFTALFLHF